MNWQILSETCLTRESNDMSEVDLRMIYQEIRDVRNEVRDVRAEVRNHRIETHTGNAELRKEQAKQGR